MTAITLYRLMLFVRLALVVALAAYTLPTVSFAMHGDMAASYVSKGTSGNAQHVHEASHSEKGDAHIHGDDARQSASANHHGKNAKEDCCSDLCLNAAIVGECQFPHLVSTSFVRVFFDDNDVFGQLQSLHRPPSIRA